ncbi:MAG: hypothetical protein U5J83_05905 [Bryobacterales bacterium]|nr:hypothetical protein [Bryobacterales bacterium]
MVTIINLPSVDNPKGVNVTLRGAGSAAGVAMRDLKLGGRGRWFEAGRRMRSSVGKAIAKRFPDGSVGNSVTLWQRANGRSSESWNGGRSAVEQ